MIQFSRLTPRRQAAILSVLRWSGIFLASLILFIVGYYIYVDVLNRAPAQVYIAQRDTATSAVYGTVSVNANGVLTLYAQNPGVLENAPDLFSRAPDTLKAQGTFVKKDQLMATVVDEKGRRDLKDAESTYQNALSRQKTGPPSLPALRGAEDTEKRSIAAGAAVPRAELERARSAIQTFANAVENEKLAIQQSVDQAVSLLKAAQDQQSRTLLKAPFDGILTGAFFLDHAYVLPNQPVFQLFTVETQLVGQVNEEDVSSLQVDMAAEVTLYSYGLTVFKAKVSAILPAPDAVSSRYTVTMDFEKPPVDLKYGMTGQMNIIRGRRENALIIPTRALTDLDQVLIVQEGIVKPRTVKIGFRSMEFTEVLDGIGEGSAVIVADQEDFRPGDHVRPVTVNNLKPKKR